MLQATMEQPKKFKSGKSRRETAVQGTNDSSIVSKCSMAAVGYFNDKFLKEFVSKNSKRSPLINRGYYIRATAIDFILKKFLSSTHSKKQILSLGAGFDSAYFRLKADGVLHNVVFCEVDFPDVVKRKHSVISTNTKLNGLIPGYFTQSQKEDPLIEINTADYKLLGVDLTQHNTLEALLKLCGIDFDTTTLLLSECVLTYMTKRCSSNVVQWAAETFYNSTFVLYEQINPNDAFGLFMQNHFKTIGSALKCINAFPTMDSQLQRFKQLGWERTEAMDMNQFYYNLVSAEERDRIERLEPFDEYEEWHLKCAHYMVLCAYNGDCNELLADYSTSNHHSSSQPTASCVTIETIPDVTNIMRIGHSSTVVGDVIVTAAGFGEECGKHQRLSSINVTHVKSFRSKVLQLDADIKKIEVGRLRQTLCSLHDRSIILIGGRMSPIYSCTQVILLRLLKSCQAKLQSESKGTEGTETCDSEIMNCVVSKEEIRTHCKLPSNHDGCNITNCNLPSNHDGCNITNCNLPSNHDGCNKEITNCNLPSNHDGCNKEITNCNLPSNHDGCNKEITNCKLPSNQNGCNLQKMCIEESVSINECTSENSDSRHLNMEHKILNLESTNVNGDSRHLDSEQNNLNLESTNLISRPKISNSTNLNSDSRHSNSETTHLNIDFINLNSEINNSDCVSKEMENCNFGDIEINTEQHKICNKKKIIPGKSLSDHYCEDQIKHSVDIDSLSVQWALVEQIGDIPVPRWRHSAVVIQNHGKEQIFVYGGRNERELALNCGYFFTPENGKWQKICNTESGPGYRQSHTASVWNNNIIIAGGLDLHLRPVNSIHLIDVETFEWKKLDVDDLLPRYAHTAEVIDNSLVLIGGVNFEHCPPGVAVINLLSGACAEYSLPIPDPSFLVMLHQHQTCYLGDGRFVIIGGGGNCFSFGTHLNRSPFILDISKCLQKDAGSLTA